MSLPAELSRLDNWYEPLSQAAKRVLGSAGSPMYVLDFIAIGAMKRSLSLASALSAMVQSKNMMCARALLRMQLDTVTRFLAYTYVDNPEAVARGVTGGAPLKTFKCSRGKKLTDAYLVERMSQEHPWVHAVYEFTSGYVHFSERQFYDSIHSLGNDEERSVQLSIAHTDTKFPESSWVEVAACFNRVTEILTSTLISYGEAKAG